MWGIFSSFNYDSAWKEVDKNLRTYPKTALSKLEEIEEQAKKEKNRPQTLRCLMTKFDGVCFVLWNEFVENQPTHKTKRYNPSRHGRMDQQHLCR